MFWQSSDSQPKSLPNMDSGRTQSHSTSSGRFSLLNYLPKAYAQSSSSPSQPQTTPTETLNKLLENHSQDSPEVKQFVLTTSNISVDDELRMMSPCGIHYANSLFYAALAAKFGKNTTEQSKAAADEYERCIVHKVDEEITFWNKVTELSELSAAFSKGIRNSYDELQQMELQ